MNNLTYSTSTLYSGPRDACRARVEHEIQKIFCLHNGCRMCSICVGIIKRQYSGLLWVAPEKAYYTRAELDDVASMVRFDRSEHEPFICVLEDVDRLSPATSGSLLKIIEEPPTGFYWMLTTQRQQDVLPTIISRSVIIPVAENVLDDHDEFFLFFTHAHTHSFDACQTLLEKYKLNEYESKVMFDKLMKYWVHQLEQGKNCLALVEWYSQCLTRYPMPGSSKLFWRTVYAATVTRSHTRDYRSA